MRMERSEPHSTGPTDRSFLVADVRSDRCPLSRLESLCLRQRERERERERERDDRSVNKQRVDYHWYTLVYFDARGE